MQFIELKNPRVLDILERFRYLYREKYDVVATNRIKQNFVGKHDLYTSEEYLNRIRNRGRGHEGSPAGGYSYPIKPDHYIGNDPQYKVDFTEVNDKLMVGLGLQASALSQLYPPQGFIDWHNNANASSFNVIFTWSETGDGWFKWLDGEKIVTMPDKKGWSCKVGYFASYDEKTPVTYHCAYTDCWRMTLSYTLGFDQDYWSDMIDYIQCEE